MNEYTNPKTGYIEGFAFNTEDVLEAHKKRWESIKDLPRKEYVVYSNSVHGRTIYFLSEKARDLSPLQKLLLANDGPVPFGGVVVDFKVEVYND